MRRAKDNGNDLRKNIFQLPNQGYLDSGKCFSHSMAADLFLRSEKSTGGPFVEFTTFQL